MEQLLPLFVFLGISAFFAVGAVWFAGWVSRLRPGLAKRSPYECGVTPVHDARNRVEVRYYLVAMLFLIFDVEAIFLIPWAVVFRKLQVFGLIEMFTFIGMLVLGYIYVWRRGAFNWSD